jgi:putative salt-induced outer membrane protein
MRLAASTLALVLPLLAAPGLAQDTCPCPPEAPPPPLWTGSAGLSYVALSGNSDSETIGFTAGFDRQPTPWGLEVRLLANRAETDGEATAERIFGGVRGKRALGERFQLFAGLSYDTDEFAGYDARMIVDSGVIWRALVGPRHELDFDAGLAWTDEEPVVGDAFDYFGGIAGLAYRWKISDNATFGERLLYYPNFDESDDWRVVSATTLEAALAASWAVRLGYLFTRDNLPALGFEKDDSTTSASIVWKR